MAEARLNCCVSGYNSESGMVSCGSGSLDVVLKLVDDHHFWLVDNLEPSSLVGGQRKTTTGSRPPFF